MIVKFLQAASSLIFFETKYSRSLSNLCIKEVPGVMQLLSNRSSDTSCPLKNDKIAVGNGVWWSGENEWANEINTKKEKEKESKLWQELLASFYGHPGLRGSAYSVADSFSHEEQPHQQPTSISWLRGISKRKGREGKKRRRPLCGFDQVKNDIQILIDSNHHWLVIHSVHISLVRRVGATVNNTVPERRREKGKDSKPKRYWKKKALHALVSSLTYPNTNCQNEGLLLFHMTNSHWP